MRKGSRLPAMAAVIGVVLLLASLARFSAAQQENRPAFVIPAFVIVERLATTGPESIQSEYGRRAREILPQYGGRYLARSQNNALLEGDGAVPCCMAILQFPSLEAAKRWYASAENQEAAKIRQSGGTFRLVAIEGLPEEARQ
jgi:uncharacterized protein (DUF1330 family)